MKKHIFEYAASDNNTAFLINARTVSQDWFNLANHFVDNINISINEQVLQHLRQDIVRRDYHEDQQQYDIKDLFERSSIVGTEFGGKIRSTNISAAVAEGFVSRISVSRDIAFNCVNLTTITFGPSISAANVHAYLTQLLDEEGKNGDNGAHHLPYLAYIGISDLGFVDIQVIQGHIQLNRQCRNTVRQFEIEDSRSTCK